MAGVDWGATRQALQRVYCAMIRPIIDYGSLIYSLASESILKKVSGIQSQALRIGSGAFRTSPDSAMLVEMAELPLKLRRLKLKMAYWCSVRGQVDTHPVKEVLQKCWEHEYVYYSSFGWNADNDAKEIGIDGIKISPTVVIPVIPPWLFQMLIVDLQLHGKINDKDRCMPKEIIEDWNKESKGRHLFNIQSKVGTERKSYGNRREDSVITRLHIAGL